MASLERPGSEAHASALLNLGELEYAAGNVEAARDAARARASYASLNSVYTALVLSNLAAYAMEAGDLDEARRICATRSSCSKRQQATDGSLGSSTSCPARGARRRPRTGRPLAGFSEALYAARGEARQLPTPRTRAPHGGARGGALGG